MQEMEVMELFKQTGAYKQGHFKLSSGLHSGAYMQCALVLQDPIVATRICGALAEKFRGDNPDVVIGPALGGVVLAYELARALGARALFSERDAEGRMTLRRGFQVSPQNKVLVAEDVLTTGGSVRELVALLEKDGIRPIGIASLVDRSAAPLDFGGVKHESLIKINVPTFHPEACPFCQEGMPITKPGSRK